MILFGLDNLKEQWEWWDYQGTMKAMTVVGIQWEEEMDICHLGPESERWTARSRLTTRSCKRRNMKQTI